jgi:heterodisulfide reductase subunit A
VFNQEISQNKAVHIYFSQAIPLVTYIDDSCIYLKEKKCRICETVCKVDAIDFQQQPEKMDINVAAVILSPGLEPYDPSVKDEYGYGRLQNVVTSMDFERLLCATGPYEGEILRASDQKHPHKIAWIQCIGSRKVTPGDNSYCSAVCCTYTQKQVILTKDHDTEAECTVFHNDIRSHGKDFETFFQRTEQLPGTRFIRSYASIVGEDPENKNVIVRYATADQGVVEEEFDMVVLSVGLNPPADYENLAAKFGIDLTSHGFCQADSTNPMETTRSGVFVSGAFQGPMDIPESVFSASGAGAQCGEFLDYRRWNLSTERTYPPEKDVSAEEPRVGVFVCHCGANIGKVVDVPSVVEHCKTLDNVVHAQEQLFSCATDSADSITETIKEKNLNRVVVAACSPRTLEPLFRDTLREGGINQYYFEMANIREHCSWVHAREKEDATEKAKDITRMSVARARLLDPLKEIDLPVNKSALVVGGGIAGMTSALSIANQGHEVHLLEKDSDLGGMARNIHYTLDGLDVQAYVGDLAQSIYQHPTIHVYTDTTITEATGYVGNFVTRVKSERGSSDIKHGATVIAVGAQAYQPTEYLYGENERVLTNLELEERVSKGDESLLGAQSLVMIQCVGCRNEDRNYCARICCNQSIKSFEPDDKPQVEAAQAEGRPVLRVAVNDPILGKKLAIDADYVSLAAAVIPPEGNKEIAQLFKVIFKEAHVKLRPVEFGTEGVFLCGIAHYPKHIPETINQAYGAASRAVTLLSRDTVTVSGSVCAVNESDCVSCGACITACTYGAIDFHETPQGRKAIVNPVLCKGDGVCNAKCPTNAIYLKHFTDEEIMCQIDMAFPEEEIIE